MHVGFLRTAVLRRASAAVCIILATDRLEKLLRKEIFRTLFFIYILPLFKRQMTFSHKETRYVSNFTWILVPVVRKSPLFDDSISYSGIPCYSTESSMKFIAVWTELDVFNALPFPRFTLSVIIFHLDGQEPNLNVSTELTEKLEQFLTYLRQHECFLTEACPDVRNLQNVHERCPVFHAFYPVIEKNNPKESERLSWKLLENTALQSPVLPNGPTTRRCYFLVLLAFLILSCFYSGNNA